MAPGASPDDLVLLLTSSSIMQRRHIVSGFVAHSLLIVSGAFLDVPFLGCMAMPVFFLSIILGVRFAFSLPVHSLHARRSVNALMLFLMFVGVLCIAATVFFTVVDASSYVRWLSRK